MGGWEWVGMDGGWVSGRLGEVGGQPLQPTSAAGDGEALGLNLVPLLKLGCESFLCAHLAEET